MNATKILQKLKNPPLRKTVLMLSKQGLDSYIFENNLSLWTESYSFYYLTLMRLIPEMSLVKKVYRAKRIDNKYITISKDVAKKFNESNKYLLLDFINYALHTRILLDRTISLAQYFMTGGNLPSFTSFNNHRKFFILPENTPYLPHEIYAQYIRDQTTWFEDLKLIRDKFIVHTQSRHIKWLGFRVEDKSQDVLLTVQIPLGSKEDGALSNVKWVHIDVMEIINHVNEFLLFFENYAISKIEINSNS